MGSKARVSEEEEEEMIDNNDQPNLNTSSSSSSTVKSSYEHPSRNSGDIFCDKCTQGRTALTADDDAQPVRVCDRCMILGVDKAASQQEIRKAYHKLALPDKNPDDEGAKEKFQQLQKVMSIPTDEEKRAVHDDYLPPGLVHNILLKLPVKSLIRFTTVCKLWRSIVTSPFFISSYLYKPQIETLILNSYDMDNNKVHFSLLEVAANSHPFTIESLSEWESPFEPKYPCVTIVGTCRGIICLAEGDMGLVSFLWNPSIRKHVRLPMPTINPEGYDAVFGFGFADDDFKVVRLVFYPQFDEDGEIDNSDLPEAEVFSLRTGSWRRLGVDARLPKVRFAWSHVFLNGVMYWVGRDAVKGNTIMVFRVAEEVFDEITLPDELATGDLSLFSIGESLAVVHFNTSHSVWLMQANGDKWSWTRKCIFSEEYVGSVVAIRKNDVILVGCPEVGLYAFDLENKETKNLGIDGDSESFLLVNYAESLELMGGQMDFAEEQDEGAEEDLIGEGAEEDLIGDGVQNILLL